MAQCIACNPADWIDEPAGKRTAHVRTVCKRCGKFIGYRPIGLDEQNAKRKLTAKEIAERDI